MRTISRSLTLEDGETRPSGSSPTSGSGHPDTDTMSTTLQPGERADAAQAGLPLKPCTEEATKNYVIHETSQDEPATRPLWKDTMTAMFGDHVKWEDVKAYVSRGRPLCEFCISYRILSLMRNYTSSARTAMFHNRPPSAIYRSPQQRTLCDTSSLSHTHHDVEPRICLESCTWLLRDPPAKSLTSYVARWDHAD